MTSTPKRVSAAEYGRLRGVSRQAISGLIKRHILKLRDGKLDVAEADAACQNLDPARSRIVEALEEVRHADTADDATDSYQAARHTHAKYLALAAKAEYLKTIGALVDAEAVRKIAFTSSRQAMQSIMAIRHRIDPMLAGESDEAKRSAIWDTELRAICSEIARVGDAPLAEG